MSDPRSFEQRMNEASEDVYQQIVTGQHPDVDAALLDAQYRASSDEEA